MALLKTEADKMSNNQLVAGVIEEIIERDDIFAALPFVRVNGKAYVYHREDVGAQNNISLGSGLPTWLDPNDAVVEGAVPFKEIVTRLRIIAGDVDVDKFLQEVESDTNDQLAIQIAKKAKALGRQFHDALVNGDATASAGKQFDGMKALSTNADANAGQSVAAGTNGAAMTLTMLDQLADMVPNGADAYIMRRGTIRAFRSLLRASGGARPDDWMQSQFGRPMLTHNGIPVLINDFLPGNEVQGSSGATTCSVYAVRLNEVDGLHGLYGGSDAGIRVENVGTVQNKDADRIRLKWYTGLCLKSSKSMARLTGVTNI
jgi:hypothetical protein